MRIHIETLLSPPQISLSKDLYRCVCELQVDLAMDYRRCVVDENRVARIYWFICRG